MHENIHPHAQSGFNFASNTYENGRPSYPPSLLEFLVLKFKINKDTTILDLGAGTGKFTHLLTQSKAHVMALEPVEGMRAKFKMLYPELSLINGNAESIPLPDNSVDMITVAQAFHWFNGELALNEIYRVLKPQGVLVLIWNTQREKSLWSQDIADLFAPYSQNTPNYQNHDWHNAFEKEGRFSPLKQKKFSNPHQANEQMVIDRFSSISSIASLEIKLKETLAEKVSMILQNSKEIEDLDQIIINYVTELYWSETRKQ